MTFNDLISTIVFGLGHIRNLALLPHLVMVGHFGEGNKERINTLQRKPFYEMWDMVLLYGRHRNHLFSYYSCEAVAHTFNPSTLEAEGRQISEFKASLIPRASPR